ncbi:hemagglutinin repeat-containing protein [Paraburkholderia solisilvae]|nr:hemagglutinin repeat-containing protein [Paraburkholderia solisilvae]
MLVAVEETATGTAKANRGESSAIGQTPTPWRMPGFTQRLTAIAVMLLFGTASTLTDAQVVAGGSHAPSVIQTANGLQQVNINKPATAAGVSVNTYSQFNVPQAGIVLNNSSVLTNTQQAGYINGNPNFASGQSAKIIVNQVNSASASAINGYIEVAGARAEVIVANPSGISVDGGGFINTSRAILTTGTPNYAADGSLANFSVNSGTITVQGAGFNASNVDEVDLLARAVQVNASLYANNLNVITGSNQVDHNTLAATPIAGSGPAPGYSIDVSQLGGMYSGKIVLVGTEQGVGVSNAGVIAAQAGDLTLTSSGQLVQSGQMSASGNVAISAASVANSGTIYAQQTASVGTSGTLTNSGTLAAQQNTGINAASVASTGTLGAGVNNDGSVGTSGDLSVAASGQLNATGENVAGGNASFSGSGVSLAGSQTAASGNLSLTATAGDLNLTGATTSAGGAVNAQAAGTLTNDRGTLTGGGVTLTAGNLSNQGGEISAQGPLVAQASGQIANQGGEFVSQGAMQMHGGAIANDQGTLQSAAGLSVSGTSLDNTAGRITSLNGDGLTVTTTGQLTNVAGTTAAGAQGGVIGGNGAVTLQGGSIVNQGVVTAQTDLDVAAQSIDNSGGSLQATDNATVNAGAHLTNSGGTIAAGQTASVTATTLDNSAGTTQAVQLSLNATNLVNHAGTITQTGSAAMNVAVSGTLDNSAGGTLQTNSTNLTLAPVTLDNDGGTILDAGTGTLTIAPGNGAGSMSNAGGEIIAAGQIAVQAASLNNATGVLAADGNIAANVAGDINNTQGAIRSLASLSLSSGGALTNTNGQIQSGTGATGDASTLAIQAASIDNTGGLISNLGAGNTTVQGGSQTVNSGGQITGNGNVSVVTSTLSNTQGAQLSGANVAVQANTVDNSGGRIGNIASSNGDVTITTTGAIASTNGAIGATHDLTVNAATLTGGGAYSATDSATVNMQGNFAPTSGFQFNAGNNLAFTLPGTFTNSALLEAADNLSVTAGAIANSGEMMAGGTLTTHSNTLQNTGSIVGGSVSLNATQSLLNVGPAALIGATNSNGLLELLAPDIENRDDTTMTDTQATTAIFGLGSIMLAGGKDANGNYTNANLIRNQSALIQSAGNMTLDASQVTNTRTTMTTTGFNQPVDPSLLTQLGISLSGCTAVTMAACSGQYVGWSDATPDMIGGVDTEPPHGGQWNSGYQYTTYTGVALANEIASISPQAQMIAGGNLDASKVGLFQNYWSAVAATGNIATPVTLDQNSWQGQTAPEVQVTYSGYYHYTNYDHSIGDWTLPFGDVPFVGSNPGGYAQAAPADIRTYALPAYESTFVAGGTLSGTGVSINNTAGNAGIPSLGLTAGQSVSGVSAGGVKGSTGLIDPIIAAATAVNVLNNLTIPQGGLFKQATAPGAEYLIETNPAFTIQTSFVSSDYYLSQLGLNPQTTEKRLGDGLYEQQLVQDQITSLTGKSVLGPYTDTQSMYQSLLAAGASLAQSLDLPLGASLSAAQVAALTTNVVIMQTEVVDGQSVLVPVVYLAQASQQNAQGPVIAATNVDLQNTQTFTNSGTVQASNTLSIQGQQIDNALGTLQSGGQMSLITTGNVDLTSATVNAGSLALNAGGNLILNTAVNTVSQVSASGATRTTTTLGAIANLNVTGDAAITTGGNFEQNAGDLNVGGSLGLSVGGNWDLGSEQSGEHQVVERANGVSNTNINTSTGSSVTVGGVSEIGVGGNLTATGANINLAGGGVIAAQGDVTLQAATTTSTVDSSSSGSDGHGSYSESSHTSDDALTGTTLNAGNSLIVAAGNDINVIGSTINLDTGTATLAAVGNVNIGAATGTHVDDSQEQHSHSEVVSGKEVSSSSDTTTTLSQGSLISADAVSISSGKDINVVGSAIVGTNAVSLGAAHDVNITTSQDTMQSSGSYQEKDSGLGTSGLSVTIGSRETATTDQESSVTNNASIIGSSTGNVSITAGHDLGITGSEVVAGGNVALTGQNVTVNAAYDTYNESQSQQVSQSGLSVGLGGGLVSLGESMANSVRQGAESGDSRLAAVQGVAAAEMAYQNRGAIGNAASGLENGDASSATQGVQLQISIGSSHSSSNSSTSITTAKGSSIIGNGNVTVTATGAPDANGSAQAGTGNITMTGATVTGKNVTLDANNAITLQSAQSTEQDSSSNSSSGWNAGVGIGVGKSTGISVFASGSNSHGQGNGSSVTQNNTTIAAGDTLTMKSGGDTTLAGAQVSGNTANVDVGGNLTMTSLQDTSTYGSNQHSSGFSGTLTYGYGGSVDASISHTSIDSNYASVNQQTGIVAGTGGFDVNVAGHTQLNGAEIASAAPAENNNLTTGSLGFTDIQNTMSYSGSSEGFSLSGGPSFAQTGASASGTTYAAVSPGTITVKSDQQSGTDSTAGLSRDTANANQTVQNTFNLQQVQNNLAFAQAFGKTATYAAGQIADELENSIPAFAEGGVARDAMHAAVAAIGAALSGGNIAGAIGGSLAGDALQSLAQPLIEQAVAQVPVEDQTALRNALNEIVAAAGGAAGGALAGGGSSGAIAGAGSAANNEVYNRQLDDSERQWASNNATAFAQFYEQQTGQTITTDQAQQMLLVNGYMMVDAAAAAGGSGYNATAAQYISAKSNGLFVATPADYNNPFANGSSSGLSPEQLAMPGGVPAVPSPDYVSANGSGMTMAYGTALNLHDGQIYLNPGANLPFAPSGSILWGFIIGKGADASSATNSLLNGGAYVGGGCFLICVGLNHSIGGNTAIEVGFGLPGASVGTSVGIPIGGPHGKIQ